MAPVTGVFQPSVCGQRGPQMASSVLHGVSVMGVGGWLAGFWVAASQVLAPRLHKLGSKEKWQKTKLNNNLSQSLFSLKTAQKDSPSFRLSLEGNVTGGHCPLWCRWSQHKIVADLQRLLSAVHRVLGLFCSVSVWVICPLPATRNKARSLQCRIGSICLLSGWLSGQLKVLKTKRETEREGERQTKTTCHRHTVAYSVKRTNPRCPLTQKADSLKPSRAVWLSGGD